MKKRILSLLLVLAMAITMLAGCGGNNGGSSKPTANFDVPEGGYDGSPVTITFYHTMGANLRGVLELYIEEFNKLYPNITIVHEQVGSYDDVRDQISTQITVGNQPNIAYCYPDHVALYNISKAVANLDNLIASDIEVTRADGTKEVLGLTQAQKDDFIDGYYAEGAQFGDGLMYTLPLSKSTEVLYYNKTFFEEKELKVPTTWEELEEVCRQIKEIDPDCIPLGYDSESNWFITMCEQLNSPYTSATGDHYLFDNDTNKGFIKEFREWYQDGLVTTQTLYGAYTSGLFAATEGTRSYMCIGSSAGASYQRPKADENGNYPFETGIATIPQANAEAAKVISQGPSLCIFQKENPQEVLASWLFVKFLTTNVDFQAEFAMASGYVPVLESVESHEVYSGFLAKADGGNYITALSAKVCMQQKNAYYTSPAFNGSSTARTEVGNLLTKCLSAETTDVDALINEAFRDAVEECEYNE
ncbi:MAG: extracellular solute-binding protein [Agathobacter sp.]|nr:extracellular solute-binding protein [Agathobacter sp.]